MVVRIKCFCRVFHLQEIVNELLGRYNKQLDPDQMSSLLAKQSSANPLWLSIACEELRVFGQFRELSDKINHLADGLLELDFVFCIWDAGDAKVSKYMVSLTLILFLMYDTDLDLLP